MAPADVLFERADQVGFMTDLVRRCSDRSLNWYRVLDRSTAVDNKAVGSGGTDATGFDPVTEADRAVEADLRQALSDRFPGHAILGEEYGLSGNHDYCWTIDPIDGTRAFITGQPMWGTLVGLQHHGRPIAGWMHVPVLCETYVAAGPVAQLELADGTTRPLTTSAVTTLGEAIVTSTHPSMFEPGEQSERFEALMVATRMTRFSGDCVNYGLLATGLVDLVVENQLQVYDIVPLIPIIEAAGGIITDLDGQAPLQGGSVVAAATEALHAKALELLNA